MHEESFLSGWLREDEEGQAEAMERVSREAKEEKTRVGKEKLREKGSRLTAKEFVSIFPCPNSLWCLFWSVLGF